MAFCQPQGDSMGQCLGADLSPICCNPNFFGPPGLPVETRGRHPECYLAQPGSTTSGIGQAIRDQIGCDAGCLPCLDFPEDLQRFGDLTNGSRWLKPDIGADSRDARGLYHDLRSNESHLVPELVRYRRGTCWDNFGLECFGWNVCSCYADNAANVVPSGTPATCGEGVTVGFPVHGLMPDQVFTQGHRWPLRSSGADTLFGDGIHCRKFTDTIEPDRNTHKVEALATEIDEMLQPMFLHSSGRQGAEVHKGGCVSNYMVPYAARVTTSECVGSFARGNTDPERHYNAGFSRARFDRLEVRENTTRLREESDVATDIDLPTVRAKNVILDFVRGHTFDAGDGTTVNFEQLDHQYAAVGRDALGAYWRQWDGDDQSADQRPVVPGIFGPCFLKHSRIPVVCELRIRFVRMTISLVLHRLFHERRFAVDTETCEPHARCRIQVLASVVATLPSGATLTRSWLPVGHEDRTTALAVENDPRGMPSVVPDIDEIVYVNPDSQRLRSLLRTEWLGFLGYHSNPSSKDQVRDVDYLAPINDQAQDLANKLSRFRVPAWPYDVDGAFGPGDQVYEGRMTIGFPANA